MTITIRLKRESNGRCSAYVVENDRRILSEGEPPLYGDSRTSYTISQDRGIGYIYETKWQQIAGFAASPSRPMPWLKEGYERIYS
jgi:hypothetical protein